MKALIEKIHCTLDDEYLYINDKAISLPASLNTIIEQNRRELMLENFLARVLYIELHTRTDFDDSTPALRQSVYSIVDKPLVALLDLSNRGKGWIDDQWRVVEVMDDKSVKAVALVDGVNVVFDHEDIVSENFSVGDVVAVRRQKSMLYTSPGYYLAISDAGMPDSNQPIIRLYVNLKWTGCCRMVTALSEFACRLQLKLYFKVSNNYAGYKRADAGVIYIGTADFAKHKSAFITFFALHADKLNGETSFFSGKLCHGVAVAEENLTISSMTRSFGERATHRLAQQLIHLKSIHLSGKML